MNERIVDIAIEANDQTGNEFDLNYKPLDAFLAKFAELIVKECASVCAKIELDEELSTEADIWDGAMMCRVEIMEHFGVEE